MNGISIKDKPELRIEDWEIAYDGDIGFIGVVVDDLNGWITMRPVFQYISNPQIQAQPGGLQIGPNMRVVLPMEMLASDVAETFRPTRRRRIADYDAADRRVFEAAVREALDNRDKLLAARSGLQLVKEMPKGVTPPGGRLG
jgi:hypothetical protein